MYHDMNCRLCGLEDETINHVLKVCREVKSEPLSGNIDVYTENTEMQKAITQRARSFADRVKEVEEERQEMED